MGLLLYACVTSGSIAVLSYTVYLLRRDLRELRNSHVNLAAEVGVVKREGKEVVTDIRNQIAEMRECFGSDSQTLHVVKINQDALRERIDPLDAYTKSLNERLVLLEIEKPQKPATAEEPPPSRRSFASQKARAEAGARKT